MVSYVSGYCLWMYCVVDSFPSLLNVMCLPVCLGLYFDIIDQKLKIGDIKGRSDNPCYVSKWSTCNLLHRSSM